MRKNSPFKEINGVMYRKCIKCQEYKVFDDFSKHKRMAFGIQNKCKVCVKEYKKEYYEQNKERVKERNKEYYKQNTEKIKEIHKEYREQNKEKIRDTQKEYYGQNKEKRQRYNKEYREQNRERENKRMKNYRNKIKNKYGVSEGTLRYRKDKNHKLKEKLRASNRHSLKRALEYYNNGKSDKLPIKSPSRLLLKLYEIQNHNCPYCSNNMKDDIHIDHLIPLSKNGSNEVHNLILCCSSCNLRKSDKELDVWLEGCNIGYDDFISDIERRNEMYFSDIVEGDLL